MLRWIITIFAVDSTLVWLLERGLVVHLPRTRRQLCRLIGLCVIVLVVRVHFSFPWSHVIAVKFVQQIGKFGGRVIQCVCCADVTDDRRKLLQ